MSKHYIAAKESSEWTLWKCWSLLSARHARAGSHCLISGPLTLTESTLISLPGSMGSPGLSSAPWCTGRSALSGTRSGPKCADSPAGSEGGQSFLSAGEGVLAGVCQVCQCQIPWSDLSCDWQAVMVWWTNDQKFIHIWCQMSWCWNGKCPLKEKCPSCF